MKKLIIAFLIILSSVATYAQNGDVGLFAGSSYYTGDLNPGTPFKNSLPAFGAFYRYLFNNRLAIKAGYSTTTLQSNDFQIGRGLSFRTKLNEISAQLEVNFAQFGIGPNEKQVSPYIFGGIGHTWFTARKDSAGLKEDPLQTDVTSFPFGLGVKFMPVENVSIGLEWGLRKTVGRNADKIDLVYEPGVRISNANDWYAFAGFWISFRLNFFNGERCEELRSVNKH
jgi:opacity protein-like surface antigen